MCFNLGLLLIVMMILLGCRRDLPTPPLPTEAIPTRTLIAETATPRLTWSPTPSDTNVPTAKSTLTREPVWTSTVGPALTSTVAPTMTPVSSVTPLPNLGMLHIYEAVNGRVCPGVVPRCPVETVFYPGYETVVRAEMIIEGETWLAVDHPLTTGSEWVWIWAEFNPNKKVQAVEWISDE